MGVLEFFFYGFKTIRLGGVRETEQFKIKVFYSDGADHVFQIGLDQLVWI